jgi:hypothetical protein
MKVIGGGKTSLHEPLFVKETQKMSAIVQTNKKTIVIPE